MKWQYDITKDGDQRQFHGDPLITDELVVVGTDGNIGHVYAFERYTGIVRWKYRVTERGVASDIVRLGDSVYAVTLGNELLSLDIKSGKARWTFHGGYSRVRLRPGRPIWKTDLETEPRCPGDNLSSHPRR